MSSLRVLVSRQWRHHVNILGFFVDVSSSLTHNIPPSGPPVTVKCFDTRCLTHTLIFRWATFSFDYSSRLPWHRFDTFTQCLKTYSSPELHSIFTKILCWWWESQTSASSPSHPKRFSVGLRSAHCDGQSMCEKLSHAPWTTLSQFEPDELWHCHPGICPCHQERKKIH